MVRTPKCTHLGLPSFAFARRYLRNRSFFLFLALLRCFSSGGSPPYTMDSCMDAYSLCMRVSPFRYPRIKGYLHLPVAFRSLSRLSSALSAKASTLRSFWLTVSDKVCLPSSRKHSVASDGLVIFACFSYTSLSRMYVSSGLIHTTFYVMLLGCLFIV